MKQNVCDMHKTAFHAHVWLACSGEGRASRQAQDFDTLTRRFPVGTSPE